MPAEIVIKDEGVRKSVPANIDVFPRKSKFQSKYAHIDDLPGPFEISSKPWSMPDDLKWMMLKDPQVFAGYMLWKTAVLVDGIQVYPAGKYKKGHPRFEKAREISQFHLDGLNNCRGGFHSKLLQLLDCCVWGQKAAVQVYRLEENGEYAGKFVLDYLRVLPNSSYRIRTDDFAVPVGLQSVEESGDKNIYPMSKFLHVVFRPYDDNALGSNILWPAYTPWYEKQQIAPERLANMTQFGSPSFIGTAPPSMTMIEMLDHNGRVLMENGQPVKIPINAHMQQALLNFQGNGSSMVIPYDSKVDTVQAKDAGELFRRYKEDTSLEIMKAMFFTANWTESTRNPSSSQSKAGENIGQFSIQDGKYMLADAIEEMLYTSTVFNFGPENADLAPNVTLGTSKREAVSLSNAIAALWSTGFFDNTQRAMLCRDLNLPEPDPDEPPVNPNTPNQPTGNVKVKGNSGEDNEDDS